MLLFATNFDPVAEFTNFVNHPYVDLPGPFDINKAVVYLWLSAVIAVGLTLWVVRSGGKTIYERELKPDELDQEGTLQGQIPAPANAADPVEMYLETRRLAPSRPGTARDDRRGSGRCTGRASAPPRGSPARRTSDAGRRSA